MCVTHTHKKLIQGNNLCAIENRAASNKDGYRKSGAAKGLLELRLEVMNFHKSSCHGYAVTMVIKRK